MLKKYLYLIFGFALLTIICGTSGFLWLVVFNPGDEISQTNIEKILAMETPVYYNDDQTRIGVFFGDAHRQYLPYEQIPKSFVNAIIAAEDRDFFHHYGVDLTGIIRAMISNIRAGKVVQGGSTITQQTAKNLFKRSGRSLHAKLKELLFALRLEYHYPKEKILEFYANQFYVSGNGHGLGVAARYYFDKQAIDLDILECAFIAGSVKRPNYYNPFIQKTENTAATARKRAKERADYVLAQMYRMGTVTASQYQDLQNREISFNQGKMSYSLNTLMDLVKEALSTPEIEDSLARHGIENVATSGIRIFTTVDQNLQDNTLLALRKELSNIDIRLRGYEREEVQTLYANMHLEGDPELKTGAFLFGKIKEIDRNAPSIKISFGEGGGKLSGSGYIDKAGLVSFLSPLIKWQRQRWSEIKSADLASFVKEFKVDDTVYVSVREINQLTGEALVDLEKYPELQGGALVMQDGLIRAMAGGMENHFFNRAISARRPMGSVMKPLVYAAALQLGWNSADALNNERDVFTYQKRPYFPRPDHLSPHKEVSMNWAGVHSENVATVWLLYHLCDNLSPANLKELLDNLGLAQHQDEPYEYYKRRVRDEFGIVIDQEALYQAAFRAATAKMGPDLIFAGEMSEYEAIKKLHYGTDFNKFTQDVEGLRKEDYDDLPNSKKLETEKEIKLRQGILKKNFLSLMKLHREFNLLWEGATPGHDASEALGHLYYNSSTLKFTYSTELPGESGWREIDSKALLKLLHPLEQEEKEKIRKSVLMGELLSEATLEALNISIEKEYDDLAALQPYSPEVLYGIQDFRILVGLKYLTALSRALGIKSKIDPVLSFPLGSNVITLFETARTYEGLTTGKLVTPVAEEKAEEGLAIIDRIEDIDGELIYRPERRTKVIFDEKTVLAVNNILRNVVEYGTGRNAKDSIRIHSRNPETEEQLRQLDIQVPVFGKTGTANRFTNAAFVGIVPGLQAGTNALSTENGYTVAAYVGFDDNRPMTWRSTHITGSSGGLPVWIRVANSILFAKDYGTKLDLVELAFTDGNKSGGPAINLLSPDSGQIKLAVDKDNGLMQSRSNSTTKETGSPTITTFGRITTNGEFEPARAFLPFWENNAIPVDQEFQETR